MYSLVEDHNSIKEWSEKWNRKHEDTKMTLQQLTKRIGTNTYSQEQLCFTKDNISELRIICVSMLSWIFEPTQQPTGCKPEARCLENTQEAWETGSLGLCDLCNKSSNKKLVKPNNAHVSCIVNQVVKVQCGILCVCCVESLQGQTGQQTGQRQSYSASLFISGQTLRRIWQALK